MSTLADAIASETTRKGPRCDTGRLLEQLPADQQADLLAAFDSDVTTAAIVRALTKLGHRVPTTVGRHRNGECSCPRTA